MAPIPPESDLCTSTHALVEDTAALVDRLKRSIHDARHCILESHRLVLMSQGLLARIDRGGARPVETTVMASPPGPRNPTPDR